MSDVSRQLYFMRHGLVVDRARHPGEDDTRPLTAEGEQRLRAQAEVLAALDLELDAVLTSPLARAAQTAAIVAQGLGLAHLVREDDRLGAGFDADGLAGILAELPDAARRVLLVGHEPGFSTVVGALIGGGRVECRKGGLVRVDYVPAQDPPGTLVWLVPARVLLRERERGHTSPTR